MFFQTKPVRFFLFLLIVFILGACPEKNRKEEPTDNPPKPGDPECSDDLSERLVEGEVRAGFITEVKELIGGMKAEGRMGDIKIYNSRAAFIIEGIRPASGYRLFGGNLVDADIIRPEGEPGRDKYGEAFFTFDLQVFNPDSVEIIDCGKSGKAHVRFTGKPAPHAFADDVVRILINPPRQEIEIVYDYFLKPDQRDLHLRITVTNPSSEYIDIKYPMIFTNHGDGAHLWAPGKGFDDVSGPLPYVGAAGRELAYSMISGYDDMHAILKYDDVTLLFTDEFDLFPGESWPFDYYFTVTDQSAAGIDEARRRLVAPEPVGIVEGRVELPPTAENGWIAVWNDFSAVTLAPVNNEGIFRVELPEGIHEIIAYAHGHIPSESVFVNVQKNNTIDASLIIEASARITSAVSDPAGNNADARITFFRLENTPSPYAPLSVRHGPAWPSNISGASYAINGPDTIILPAGKYRAVATRGPAWEMDETIFEAEPLDDISLSFVISQAVDTTGWVSSDMHLHAYLSPDSHVPFETRVKQAVTDALDIPLLTEHVWAGSLHETAVQMNLDHLVTGIAGQEVTTYGYGHFNVFPIPLNPDLPNNGGVFEHGQSPTELFAAMNAVNNGNNIIQINHPRGPGDATPVSYFSWVGLDPVTGSVEREDGWTADWDLIEVFNGSCGGSRNLATLADWIGLTNLGYRKGISGTSDSHHERRIPGTPRNWIQVDREAVQLNHDEIIAPLKARKSFVSCGPFVRFSAEDGTGLGGMTTVNEDGLVIFNVMVEAPTWMTLNELILLENGLPLQTIDIRGTNGEVQRFNDVLIAEPSADSWYSIEVKGSGSLVPVSWSGPPYAITNPIEVDADRDGIWTPPALQ